MIERLEATREADACVAVAMGWVWLRRPIWCTRWLGPMSEIEEHGGVFGTVRECQPEDMDECEVEDPNGEDARLPRFTSDPAQVVPVLKRIGGWGYAVELVRRPADGAWCAIAWWGEPGIVAPDPIADEQAATANLACCAALLQVWERVKRE